MLWQTRIERVVAARPHIPDWRHEHGVRLLVSCVGALVVLVSVCMAAPTVLVRAAPLAMPDASVSCDHIPANWSRTGCAPGGATSDGFGLSFQCVELAARFSAWAFGDSPGSRVETTPTRLMT